MEIHKANLEAQNTTRAILRTPATAVIPLLPHSQLNAATALVGQNSIHPLLMAASNVSASSQSYPEPVSNSLLSQQQGSMPQSSQLHTPVAGVLSSSNAPAAATQSQPSLHLTAATNSCYSSNGSLMSTSGSGISPNSTQISSSSSLPMAYLISKPATAAAVAAAQAAAVAQAQAAQIAVNNSNTLSSSTPAVVPSPQGVLALPNPHTANQLYALAAQQAAAVRNGNNTNPSVTIAANTVSNIFQQELNNPTSPFSLGTSQNTSAAQAAAAAAVQAAGMNQNAVAAAQAAAAVAARTNTIPTSVSPAVASYHVTPKLKSPAGMLTITSGRGSDKFAPY